MGGAPVEVKPQTFTTTGNSTLNSHSVKDSTNVQTEINITSDTLFLILLFLLFVAILIVYSVNRFHTRIHQQQIQALQAHPALQRREEREDQVETHL